jgi:molybdate transport system substrate-binding protein
MSIFWENVITGFIKRKNLTTLCILILFSALFLLNGCKTNNRLTEKNLLVFAGSASKPPMEEIKAAFEKITGIKVEINYGGSGDMLSQIKLAKKGDVYLPGSSDWMEKAKSDGDVAAGSEKHVAFVVPSVNVQKGNPKKIKSLRDLLKPNIRVAIANPETVCLGVYAVETFENSFTSKEIKTLRKNIVNYAASCEKTANAISLGQVDAVIGWSVFQYWDPKRIETISLQPDEITRVGYIPIAVVKYSKNKQSAKKFIEFVASQTGKRIFKKHKYFMSEKAAFDYIGQEKPVGGQYDVPKKWIVK